MLAHDILLPGAVTGIGSLPGVVIQHALNLIAEFCPELPFWPQLPQRAPQEGMVEQALYPFAHLLRQHAQGYGYDVQSLADMLHYLDAGEAMLHSSCAAGFFAFDAALADGAFPHARACKGQVIGPITLAAQLFHAGKSLLEQPTILTSIGRYIRRLAGWQVERLRCHNKPMLLFLDEPCLTMVPLDSDALQVLQQTIEAVRAMGVLVGLHSCATPERAVHAAAMSRVQPDILSFDAHHGLELFCADPDAQTFWRNGGYVAFGLVPTWNNLQAGDANALFQRWLAAAREVGDPGELAQRSLVTASCGLGLLDEAAARQSFVLAREVGELLRSQVHSSLIPDSENQAVTTNITNTTNISLV
jgi:hypothetical protein